PMGGGIELLHPAEPACEPLRPGRQRGRRVDARPHRGFGIGLAHVHGAGLCSAKNLLSSGLLTTPAKLSNFPCSAISRAERRNAFMATRAKVPPTLMRRTPMSAISCTVNTSVDISRLTGSGATALTTAVTCSRVRMPGG